ncbi:RNA polymerase subunit sigma-70 [Eubacterium pyruvativorans]|uniref:RNA polymerase subunit sigma-70 n=1 Tax=Eubacterium pyruvativorans TaxID=155865 RepID=UPI0015698939|nr:RNA polymerase subunit sigma-70 [Eubacterium pyruvativorans]
MTNNEKLKIDLLRSEGNGYKRIASETGIPIGTVKAYLRRKDKAKKAMDHRCPNCGKYVEQTPGRKEKKFCSDACRMAWWNRHPDAVNRKAVYTYNCAYCGGEFLAYGNVRRKYCSHACYIKDRFGGDRNDH